MKMKFLSNIPKNLLQKGLPAGAGQLLSNAIINNFDKVPMFSKIPYGGQIASALIGAAMADGKGMMEYAGVGMMGNAIAEPVGKMIPVLGGYDESDIQDVLAEVIEGADDVAEDYIRKLGQNGQKELADDNDPYRMLQDNVLAEEIDEELDEDLEDDLLQDAFLIQEGSEE